MLPTTMQPSTFRLLFGSTNLLKKSASSVSYSKCLPWQVWRRLSSGSQKLTSGEKQQSKSRKLCTNSGRTEPPRVLITGGLGQLGRGLAETMSLVQAEYWQDPFNLDKYRKRCIFLPDINQENTFKQEYKDRLSNISNLVLVMFLDDTMVQPKESEWFGFYKDNQDKETYALSESVIWTKDLLGLKSLKSNGRLHFLSSPTDHLRISGAWFDKNLMPFIKVESFQVHLPVVLT